MKKILTFTFLMAVLLSGCSSPTAPSGGAVSTPIMITSEVSTVIARGGGTEAPLLTARPPTSIPTLAGASSVTELKYKVLDQFPDFFFCDPDYYPVAREDETTLAEQAFPELQANQEEFQAILDHAGLSGQTTFTDEQMLQIYREHKKLNAILFQFVDNQYQFQIQTGLEGQPGTVITGTIDGSGTIEIVQREDGFPTCPICLAAGTLIDTPRGFIRVEYLQMGDLVWTQNEAGQRVTASIIRTRRVRVPTTHQIVHLLLADGRELWASAGHPTSDGQRLGDLQTGKILDGSRISSLERVPYGQAHTFDILPSGSTGFYWANGILLDSTLSSP